MCKSKTTKPKEKKKPPKAKKKKAPTLSKLKKQLDTLYSKWLRMSNADEEGICTCVSCGARLFWKDIQNGHYCSRRHEILRWSPLNTFPQCKKCNIFTEGNKIWYRRNLVDNIFNETKVREIEDKSLEPSPFKRADIEKMIRHYKSEVKRLENEFKEKGIYEREGK